MRRESLRMGLTDAADEAELDDIYKAERRLFYVACIRAREHLLITGVAPGSKYLRDLADRLYERREEGGWGQRYMCAQRRTNFKRLRFSREIPQPDEAPVRVAGNRQRQARSA